jgi:pyrroline-5-carboxylate reductase
MKIGFIGGGNMCQAIIGGLITKGRAAGDMIVVEPNEAARDTLASLEVAVTPAVEARIFDCDVIVLAVKPQVMREAILPLSGKLTSPLVVTIAAGIRTQDLARWLGGVKPYARIVRAMPNTPALMQAGITGLYAAPALEAGDKAIAEELLGAVGKTVWLDDEAMLDAVTAVSGSGPAYVFYFIEALEDAAKELGFSAEAARMFAIETFRGGAILAAASSDSPATLRANVTSKRGTTERAIEHFDAAALKQQFIAGVKAAALRSAELGAQLGNS